MKKIFFKTTIILMFLIITSGLSLARQGHGPGDGSGPVHDIFDGDYFTYSGTITSMIPGHGIEIETDQGIVIVFGLGPKRYWNRLEVERPKVGDRVSVDGYAVDFFGEIRNIAVSITITVDEDELEIELRDSETGLPLWRKWRK